MRVRVRAQGKVNLRLAVLGRETSGYHGIETIFHKIALADDVTLALGPPGSHTVRCSVDVGPVEENLAYRAARAYLARSGWNTGFEIGITKRIPAGGLGGGSADAAATLRALDALAPEPLGAATLRSLAAALGADVPFLVSDAAMALAWGHGERFLALDALPPRTIALVTPDFRVATAQAYGWLARGMAGDVGSAPHAALLRPWHLANRGEVVPWAGNDFEPVVGARFPAVARIARALRAHGAAIAQLSGSGSTVFGVFDTPPDVHALTLATGASVTLTQSATGVEAVHRID